MTQVVALLDTENGRVGVSFPDFPGCTTVGRNADEALAKAADVLAFHVEGLAEDGPLPEVRTLAQLQRDSQFRTDSKGALIVLVPYAPPSRAVRINVTMDESLLERIDRAASSAGETRSGFLALAAKARIERQAGRGHYGRRKNRTSDRKAKTATKHRRKRSG